MTTGLLWFDNSGKPLAEKVAAAAAQYLKKYGRVPEICLVHPSTQIDVPEIQGANGSKISVRVWRSILPGHLWIGIEETLAPDATAGVPTEETK